MYTVQLPKEKCGFCIDFSANKRWSKVSQTISALCCPICFQENISPHQDKHSKNQPPIPYLICDKERVKKKKDSKQ